MATFWEIDAHPEDHMISLYFDYTHGKNRENLLCYEGKLWTIIFFPTI